ncbi:protein EMSY-LIKE 3-like isoform X2 [Ananas comosus]|uniref:Protein EMSY-LIKE 3-like isoform X2 n=1 Tax=Ananas comosus TaxID=4615 RepID=A0A6P5EF64_ANACO|nr:protein EMSY-LIKE 3-like isoform X2 [Ananas comosus]
MGSSKSDSGETDDDLPDPGTLRASRSAHNSGATEMASAPLSRGEDEIDIELQVHCLETKAYSAVLRAFNAQSDVLSWEKAELISDIRKGLRISSAEHKEILRKISSDELVKSIRTRQMDSDTQMTTCERLKSGYAAASLLALYPCSVQPLPAAVPSSLAVSNCDLKRTNLIDDHCGGHAFSPQLNRRKVTQDRQPRSMAKPGGLLVVRTSKKCSVPSGTDSLKPRPDVIEIRATDELINEIEKFCRENPDRANVKRAKSILRDHEKALMEAIGRLSC